MKRILVPLDGSALAEAALPVAARIAGAFGAELLLLHVIETAPPEAVHGQPHLADVPGALAYLRAKAAEWGRGRAVAIHVHDEARADSARAIGEHAGELSSDLVVLATHGRHRFGTFLRGSVAQRALFFGGAPVLSIPAEAPPDAGAWKTLVLAVDGSGEHGLPLAWLGSFARGLGLAVELHLSVDTRSSLSGESMDIARSLPASTAWALEAATVESEVWLAQLSASPDLAGLPVSRSLARGSADKTLAGRLRGREEVLPAIVTHGRLGLDAVWEGSLAARILARLPGPALLLRAE